MNDIGKNMDDPEVQRKHIDLLDATTIFKYFSIARVRPELPIITELIHSGNISFLIDDILDYKLMNKKNYYQTQTYASGEIYIDSVMDSLLGQAFYNSCQIKVLEKFLVGGSDENLPENVKGSNLFPLRVPKAFQVFLKKYIMIK